DPVSNPNIEEATYDSDKNSHGRCTSSLYEDDVKVMEVKEKNLASSYQDSEYTRSSDGSQYSVGRSKDSPMEVSFFSLS
ncbi:unnamed protein product, partial [Schistosoma curassoni]|uniref:NBPF n=1 Tax=Schistosoma curassoni TaxID=6186 RepID=A0A183JQN4_9TREM